MLRSRSRRAFARALTPRSCRLLLAAAGLALPAPASAGWQILDGALHHLRAGGAREWSDFPELPEGPELAVRFPGRRNAVEGTLRLRQQDVKQAWKVLLNGKELGRLVTDENDLVIHLPVPAGTLVDGENVVTIAPADRTADDLRAGELAFDERPRAEVLAEASVEVRVLAGDPPDAPAPLPCRLTVVEASGALATLGAMGGRLAVRTGVIYSGNGEARFGLPAGTYTIHAGRGFEYGVESARVTVRPGDSLRKEMVLRREVPTEGYVSCDPHVHTLTHSGHGDATEDERLLALAGEGIEMPVATEHNLQVDYRAAAERTGMQRWLTPVAGNEVTTAVGHFNVFPAPAGGPVPDPKARDWPSLFASIGERTGAAVVILNHARDIHAGYRPFGPEHHNAATGENLDGWRLLANGMEVVNSGAQQTDCLRLYRDWFALLNRGILLTPVGSSDSHDVARYIVGQGRTYIRCRDDRPGEIDVAEAVAGFRAGRVLVSCGLLADIRVNDAHGPGDLVPAGEEVKVAVRVLGPGWATAEEVELYANGVKVRAAAIPGGDRPGVKWSGVWTLPRVAHDVHLAAIATGPGIQAAYWPIAKPYQPTSPAVNRRVVGSTGAVWIDGDGDGRRTSALEYARRALDAAGPGAANLAQALRGHDEAVAVQAAGLLQARGVAVENDEVLAMAREAGPQVESGFRAYLEAWKESRAARHPPAAPR